MLKCFEYVYVFVSFNIIATFRALCSIFQFRNEMNRALGHLWAHIGWTGTGEPPDDGEMNDMTLSSRHRIRNSSPGGLRPSTQPLGHGGSPQYTSLTRGWGRNIFVSYKLPRLGTEPQTLAWKAAVLTTTLGPLPFHFRNGCEEDKSPSCALGSPCHVSD